MSVRSWARAFWRPFALVGVVAAGLIVYGATPRLSATAPAAAVSTAATPATATLPMVGSYADAVSHAVPAVVTVRIERKATTTDQSEFGPDLFQRFFRGEGGQLGRNQMPSIERGLGSGVIVNADGNILTNNHVVDSADHVAVTLSDGREFTAKVLGTDPATDLAVVHIDAKNLPALTLGDSDRVRVGDVVLAVGNPLGVGETVTMGIISAKGRTTAGANGNYEDFLQTDAPINQGNSGGALITAAGELVGINSQILSNDSGGNIGIGFAIPASMAKNVMDQLVATGHVRRAIIGVSVQAVTSDLAASLNLGAVRGALVDSVEAEGPASKAGILKGDVILSVNSQPVADSNELRNRISTMTPGSTVTVDLQRQGTDRRVKVTLGELSDSTHAAAGRPSQKEDLGMTLEPLTPALAEQAHVANSTSGAIVTDVDPSGAAASAGIKAGDVVREVNGRAIKSPNDVRDALALHTGRPALAYIERGDTGFYVALNGHS